MSKHWKFTSTVALAFGSCNVGKYMKVITFVLTRRQAQL